MIPCDYRNLDSCSTSSAFSLLILIFGVFSRYFLLHSKALIFFLLIVFLMISFGVISPSASFVISKSELDLLDLPTHSLMYITYKNMFLLLRLD